MLLEFNKNKPKRYVMVVEASGVNTDDLDITFTIKIDGIKYGFPCTLVENKVKIDIPALDSIIKNLKPGKYNATLDITGAGNYFLQPFNEKIEIVEIPDVKVDKGSLQEDKLSVIVSELIDDDKEIIDEKTINKNGDKNKTKKINNIFKEDTKTPLKKLLDNILDE